MDATGGNLKQLTTGGYDNPAMCSPDGKWLVFSGLVGSKFTAQRVSVDGGAVTTLSDSILTCGCINISPDGKAIAFQTQASTGAPIGIKILDFTTLQPIKISSAILAPAAKSATPPTAKPSAISSAKKASTPSGFLPSTARLATSSPTSPPSASSTSTGAPTAKNSP